MHTMIKVSPPLSGRDGQTKCPKSKEFFGVLTLSCYAVNEKVRYQKVHRESSCGSWMLVTTQFRLCKLAMSSSMVGEGMGDTNRGLGTSYNPSTTRLLKVNFVTSNVTAEIDGFFNLSFR